MLMLWISDSDLAQALETVIIVFIKVHPVLLLTRYLNTMNRYIEDDALVDTTDPS